MAFIALHFARFPRTLVLVFIAFLYFIAFTGLIALLVRMASCCLMTRHCFSYLLRRCNSPRHCFSSFTISAHLTLKAKSFRTLEVLKEPLGSCMEANRQLNKCRSLTFRKHCVSVWRGARPPARPSARSPACLPAHPPGRLPARPPSRPPVPPRDLNKSTVYHNKSFIHK